MSFLVVDGELYMWGRNSNGQLGLGKSKSVLCSVLSGVSCYCLLYFNKFFSSGRNVRIFGYSDKYMCYLFSSCLWGQCSAEAANVLLVPTKVECLTGVVIKMVALGSEHSIAVTGLM